MDRTIYILLMAVSINLLSFSAFAQERRTGASEPDSEYMKSEREPRDVGGGSFFDFIPFLGGRSREAVPSERLVPTPLPKKSKPVLSKEKMGQLQAAAERWLLTSEFTEPMLRQDEDTRYYRDYIVFSGEYVMEVMRGDTEERPFVGHVYVKGDYFKTEAHGDPDAAESDFSFKYQKRDFRLIFDRVEKWDYSENHDEYPFTFTERWEFHKLQSRPTVDLSRNASSSIERSATENGDGMPPEPASE